MAEEPFLWKVDRFDDVQILRYQVPDWDKLTLQQKKLAYYIAEAGYSGRDILYHQVRQSAGRCEGTFAPEIPSLGGFFCPFVFKRSVLQHHRFAMDIRKALVSELPV